MPGDAGKPVKPYDSKKNRKQLIPAATPQPLNRRTQPLSFSRPLPEHNKAPNPRPHTTQHLGPSITAHLTRSTESSCNVVACLLASDSKILKRHPVLSVVLRYRRRRVSAAQVAFVGHACCQRHRASCDDAHGRSTTSARISKCDLRLVLYLWAFISNIHHV